MDLETRNFVDECLRNVSVDRHRVRTPEEIRENERTMAQIRLNGAAALERLENGQREAYQKIRHMRYR